MGCLLKMLSDMLQKPSTTLSYPHMSQTKVKLGPTKTFYPVPPSLVDIATARNPSLFGPTDRDLGLTEMGLQTLCFPFVTFRSTERANRSHRDCNVNSVFPLCNFSVSPSSTRSHRKSKSVPPSLPDQLSG